MPKITTGPPPSGGGSSAVASCVLQTGAVADAGPIAGYPFLWSALYDDIYNENTLSAIPTGLGLSFAHNGTDNTLTTTMAGTWAFTYTIPLQPDATYQGEFDYSGDIPLVVYPLPMLPVGGTTIVAPVCHVVRLPTGTAIEPRLRTAVAATATPYSLSQVTLIVAHLG